MLKNDLDDIQKGRTAEGKKENRYLVINQNEPYAALVEDLILNKASADDIPEGIKDEILKDYAEDL